MSDQENTQTSKYAGRGQDSINQNDGMPLIRILQSNSVEMDPTKKGHALKKIDGSKAGDLFHPNLGILPQPVEFIPVKWASFYEEKTGTGANTRVTGTHPDEIILSPLYSKEKVDNVTREYITVDTYDANGRVIGKSKNQLVKTIIMGVILPEFKNTPAVIKFQMKGLTKVRELQTAVQRYRYPNDPWTLPPTFARSFTMKTVAESNDKGGWFGYSFEAKRVLSETADQLLMDMADSLLNHNLLLSAGPAAAAEAEDTTDANDDRPF